MISVKTAASYIYDRYLNETNSVIDEMKLHKLLYLAQRESIVMLNRPMFPERFEAWRYGPVMVCIRELYKNRQFQDLCKMPCELVDFLPVFDSIFEKYASDDSWSLSDLTHCEFSWQNARKNCAPEAQCNALMDVEDIRKDAERIKMRRFYFNEVLLSINENK